MRIGPGFGFILCLTTGLWAQGNVVNPAGIAGSPGVSRSLGSVVNPAQGGIRVPPPGGRKPAPARASSVYLYPVYLGGGYATPYITQDGSMGAAPAVQPDYSVPQQPQPVTPVIINYNYGTPPPPAPDMSGARPQPAVEDDSSTEPSHYLIAFKDHTIYAATAYWVDGDTLHYFTAGNVHNQASLSLVDREFTERLNKEAGVDVRLPAPK